MQNPAQSKEPVGQSNLYLTPFPPLYDRTFIFNNNVAATCGQADGWLGRLDAKGTFSSPMESALHTGRRGTVLVGDDATFHPVRVRAAAGAARAGTSDGESPA